MLPLFFLMSITVTTTVSAYGKIDGLTDTLLQEVMSRYGADPELLQDNEYMANPNVHPPMSINRVAKDFHERFKPRMDDILLSREPSIRDQEFLQHSSLFGHQYMTGGAGEGNQRLKPDGSIKNIQVVKTDSVLPAYCNPPNPCPIGYTSDDGCIEDFANSASFSKDYQASQDCMCDSEHMFDCPGNTEENELDALARSIQNQAISESTFDKLVENMSMEQPDHKVVAKKFFNKKINQIKRKRDEEYLSSNPNPYLIGDKLPVVAKKSPEHQKH